MDRVGSYGSASPRHLGPAHLRSSHVIGSFSSSEEEPEEFQREWLLLIILNLLGGLGSLGRVLLWSHWPCPRVGGGPPQEVQSSWF